MLAGDGGNITLQIGKDGVLLVDTGLTQMSDQALAAIRKFTDKPIHYILNTHVDADHTGGNEAFGKAGNTITGGDVADDIKGLDKGAAIIAHQRVLERMSADGPAPFARSPHRRLSGGKQKDLYFNDEPVVLLHQPAAHTDGDSLVFFRGSDVISTGDIFVTTSYPGHRSGARRQHSGHHRFAESHHRSHRSRGPAGRRHARHSRPRPHLRRGGRGGVSRHGHYHSRSHRRHVEEGHDARTSEGGRPTEDYDPRYGSNTAFVEAVYRSLSRKK